MMRQGFIASCVFGVAAEIRNSTLGNSDCPPDGFSSIDPATLEAQGGLHAFIAKRWFIQQQQEVAYLPQERNFCVSAAYSMRPAPSNPLTLPWWRYDIDVLNYAQTNSGEASAAELCADLVSSERGQLAVAPCFLPSFTAGPYWILDYNEVRGYALISGGPPSFESDEGTCKPGSGTNNAGLWIFTRCPNPGEALINEVRELAKKLNFDLSILNPVQHHSGCRYGLDDNEFDALQEELIKIGCSGEVALA